MSENYQRNNSISTELNKFDRFLMKSVFIYTKLSQIDNFHTFYNLMKYDRRWNISLVWILVHTSFRCRKIPSKTFERIENKPDEKHNEQNILRKSGKNVYLTWENWINRWSFSSAGKS